MKNLLTRLWKEEEGQDLTEYALLMVLIAVAAAATITTFKGSLTTAFTNVGNQLT